MRHTSDYSRPPIHSSPTVNPPYQMIRVPVCDETLPEKLIRWLQLTYGNLISPQTLTAFEQTLTYAVGVQALSIEEITNENHGAN